MEREYLVSILEYEKVRSAIAGACAGLTSALLTCTTNCNLSANGHGEVANAKYKTFTIINSIFLVTGYMENRGNQGII